MLKEQVFDSLESPQSVFSMAVPALSFRECLTCSTRHKRGPRTAAGDLRRGLFCPPKKMHRSVTTKVLSPDTCVRCDSRKHGDLLKFLTDIVVCATRRKKGTALHDGVGSSMFFFQVTAELQRMPTDNSEDRTPRRTHIFLSLVVSRMPEHIFNLHTHMRVAQDVHR